MQIYGSGKQTRSFQYVSDLVDGLIALMDSNYTAPVNLGNPIERTIEDFAVIIRDLVGGNSRIAQMSAVEDDPQRRRPDITRARKYLNWEPKVKPFLRKIIFLNTTLYLFFHFPFSGFIGNWLSENNRLF